MVSGCYSPWKHWDSNVWYSQTCSKIHCELNSHHNSKTPMGKCFSTEKTGGGKGVTIRLSEEWHTARESFHPVLTFQQLLRIQLQRQPSLHDSTMHQLFLPLLPYFSLPNLHKHQTMISHQVLLHNYQHQKTQAGNLPVGKLHLLHWEMAARLKIRYEYMFGGFLHTWNHDVLKFWKSVNDV